MIIIHVLLIAPFVSKLSKANDSCIVLLHSMSSVKLTASEKEYSSGNFTPLLEQSHFFVSPLRAKP